MTAAPGTPSPAVVVTAAGDGIGAATAAAFARDGYPVALVDLDGDALARTVAELPAGARAVPVTADVTDEDGAARAVATAVEQFGGLTTLVNVVGGSRPGRAVPQLELSEWNHWLGLNLTSVFLMCRAALPHLARTNGTVVNVSSGAGLRGMSANPAYCAAKAGVVGLTRALAIDHAADGVRVNCVAPGPVRTPLMRRNRGADEIAAIGGRTVLGRVGEPAEIAGAIRWLAGAESSYVTGQTLEVDGGVAPVV